MSVEKDMENFAATGITRPVDAMGRIVIPKELRERYSIGTNDLVEVFTVKGGIFLKKYTPGCLLCGSFEGIEVFRGRQFCKNCIAGIKEL